MKQKISLLLSGGDFRSNRQAKRVTLLALRHRALIKDVVTACVGSDPLVRMRAADSLESISRENPKLLQPFKKILTTKATAIPQQEVRWHLAQIFPRLRLSNKEIQKTWAVLKSWYVDKHEKSRIVKVFSLDSMTRLSLTDAVLRKKTKPLVQAASRATIFSIRARAKKLLPLLK